MSLKSLCKPFLLSPLIFFINTVFAQDPIVKTWMIKDKTAKIEIYKGHDAKFYGKIVWLKKPTVDGKAKIDIHNPDPAKRTRPFMGMVVLHNLTKTQEGVYEKGTIYDPTTGKTFNCKMELDGDTLYVRGFIGVSLLGKTTFWTKVD